MSNRDFFPRFYDSEGKVMLYWQCYMQSAFNRLTDTQHFGLLYNLLRNPGIIMMRCTGLRDKNGKLIFEGDIIEKQNQKFVIKYEFDSFVAYSEEKKPVSVYGLFTFKLCCGGWPEKETENTIEIIGNIHENPELLEAS